MKEAQNKTWQNYYFETKAETILSFETKTKNVGLPTFNSLFVQYEHLYEIYRHYTERANLGLSCLSKGRKLHTKGFCVLRAELESLVWIRR